MYTLDWLFAQIDVVSLGRIANKEGKSDQLDTQHTELNDVVEEDNDLIKYI